MSNEKTLPLVDAHCHIDLYDDPAQVVAEAEAHQVYTIAVTNAPSVFAHTAQLTVNSRYVRAALGLHPELVHSHGHEVNRFSLLLSQTRYVGEIGLDYTTKDSSIRKAQRAVLDQILSLCAESGNKILTLHSRRAASDTIAAVGKDYPGKAILHWFSGNHSELERATEYGMYFSVNAAMVRASKGRSIIQRIPLDRMLTESDGPFVILNNQPANPVSINQTVHGLAEIWGIAADEAGERVISNFRRLLTTENHSPSEY